MDQDRGIRRGPWISAILLVMACIALLDRCGRQAEAHSGHDHIPLAAEQYREQLTLEVSYYFGVREPVSTFAGLFHQESNWDRKASNLIGAKGLGQIMDATSGDLVKWYSAELGHVPRPLDGEWAIMATTLYLRRLYGQLQGAFPEQEALWPAALASYNGGLGWVLRERKHCTGIGLAGCNPSRWFDHVERFCLRSLASCKENRAYSRQIIFRWKPLYAKAGW